MREPPITFCRESIQAVYDRTKTQTRRIEGLKILNEHPDFYRDATLLSDGTWRFNGYGTADFKFVKPRYGVGDECWIKEEFRFTGGGSWKGVLYRADGEDTVQSYVGINDGRAVTLPESLWSQWDHYVYKTKISCGWRSSRFMPKWASRGKVRILQVKDPERINLISHEDAIAEGFPGENWVKNSPYINGPHTDDGVLPQEQFEALWNRLHKIPNERFEHGAWEFPYVFELIEEPK